MTCQWNEYLKIIISIFIIFCVHIDYNDFDFREFWKLWPKNWKRNCRQWRPSQKGLSRLHITGQPTSHVSSPSKTVEVMKICSISNDELLISSLEESKWWISRLKTCSKHVFEDWILKIECWWSQVTSTEKQSNIDVSLVCICKCNTLYQHVHVHIAFKD